MKTLRVSLVIGLGFVIVVVGCGRKAVPTTSIKSEVHDSVITKEVTRFVAVKLPGDTVTITDYIECDSITNKPLPKKINAHGARAKIAITINSSGLITGTGGCDSIKAVVEAKDKLIYQLRIENKTLNETKFVHQPAWFDIAARWIASVFILLIIGCVVLKLTA